MGGDDIVLENDNELIMRNTLRIKDTGESGIFPLLVADRSNPRSSNMDKVSPRATAVDKKSRNNDLTEALYSKKILVHKDESRDARSKGISKTGTAQNLRKKQQHELHDISAATLHTSNH